MIMLHILLFILKLIGILLLIILGLVVLTICIVLFTPLRYHVSGSCKGKLETLNACIQFSVFFRLLRGKVIYADQNVVWELYVAWKRLSGSEPAESLKEEAESLKEPLEEESGEAIEEKVPTAVQAAESIEKAVELTVEEADQSDFDKPAVEMTEIKEEEGIFEKIKCTIQKICDKMKLLYGKAEIVQQFLTNEVHQDAFRRVVKGGKTLLYKLRPKKAGGEVIFGFSDPSWTGKLLAVCSMLHPYLGRDVLFYPDFQEKKLEGSLYIKGSLRMLPAAAFAVRLLLAKSIRTTIHDIRNFHF